MIVIIKGDKEGKHYSLLRLTGTWGGYFFPAGKLILCVPAPSSQFSSINSAHFHGLSAKQAFSTLTATSFSRYIAIELFYSRRTSLLILADHE
jgi:hypothetical protein